MDIKSTTGKLLKGDISGVVSDVKNQIERSLSLIGVIIVTVAAIAACLLMTRHPDVGKANTHLTTLLCYQCTRGLRKS